MLSPQELSSDRGGFPGKNLREIVDERSGIAVSFGGQTLRYHSHLGYGCRCIRLGSPIAHSGGQISSHVSGKSGRTMPLSRSEVRVILLGPTERLEHRNSCFVHPTPINIAFFNLRAISRGGMTARAQVHKLESTGHVYGASERKFDHSAAVGVQRNRAKLLQNIRNAGVADIMSQELFYARASPGSYQTTFERFFREPRT